MSLGSSFVTQEEPDLFRPNKKNLKILSMEDALVDHAALDKEEDSDKDVEDEDEPDSEDEEERISRMELEVELSKQLAKEENSRREFHKKMTKDGSSKKESKAKAAAREWG